tara:strand:- start:2188 stop:3276 length:1089 start_codon:yes stop_codon:yes gene_type:complete
MATYTAAQMNGAGVQGETISGSTLFMFNNPGGSSYFTIETVQDRTGSFVGKQATTSGSWVEVTTGMGVVNSQYFAAAVVPPGTSSVMLTPASPVTGSNYNFKGTGAFTMTTFTPAALFTGGEKGAWFDASDLSTLFQNVAGTVPVTAVGQFVGKWLDKSGNGNHAVAAADDTTRPTYQVDTEGNPNITFIKSPASVLLTPAVDFTGTAVMTVCAGLNPTDQSSAGIAVSLSSNPTVSTGTFIIGAPSSTADHSIYLRGTATLIARVANVVDGDDIITALLDISQATKELELIPRLNYVELSGAQIAWTGSDAGTGTFGNHPIYLGSSATPYGGKIYQLIVRGARTSAAGIYQMEAFTDAKLD